ncbi:MAG: hypothetical protein AB7E80_13510 [Hyphomicrobiaceae bacterium]
MSIAKIIPAAAILTVALSGAAAAHSVKPVDRILEKQTGFIELGRRTGDITWTEGNRLRAEQREIARLRQQFLADGRLTGREYRELRARQKEAKSHIIQEASDSRRRVWWLPRFGR